MSVVIPDMSEVRSIIESEAYKQMDEDIKNYKIGEDKELDLLNRELRIIKKNPNTGLYYIDKNSYYKVFLKQYFLKAKKDLGY